MRYNRTKPLVLAAMLGALSVVLMLILSPFTKIAPYLAALVTACVTTEECGRRYALGAYAAVSALTLFVLPDKVTGIWYVSYFGIYPIVKSFAEQFGAVRGIIIKTVYGIIALATLTALLRLFVPAAAIRWWYYAAAVPVFVLFDIAITRGIAVYAQKIKPIINNN